MTAVEMWKVYIPYELFIQPESFLLGHVNTNTKSVYITAASCDISVPNQVSEQLNLLGKWTESNFAHKPVSRKNSVWINLSKNENVDIVCDAYENGVSKRCICIIYNPTEILKSAVLRQRSESLLETSDNIVSLVKALRASEHVFSDFEAHEGSTVFCWRPKQSPLLDHGLKMLLMLLYAIHFPFRRFGNRLPVESKVWSGTTGSLFGPPTCFTQLGSRSRKFVDAKHNYQNVPNQRLSVVNLCVTQLLDTILGLALMYFLMHDNMAQHLANICLANGDKIADEMKALLDWLTGAPAGLKLNSQLTHFLGKFFQYHIFLWTGYLAFIRPVLGGIIYYSSVAGVLGLTLQLALFQDIFATMTIHIYCFYVYAARLYKLQTYALGSLWRLFRGKKWNVLRQRVDSAKYDADQLFVGTLLFTVLLFLLPTIGLYYVVFTVLRILVVAVQGAVFRVRKFISVMPWWSILNWLVRSSSLTDSVVFNTVSHTDTCLVLSMQGTQPSLSTVLSLTKDTSDVGTSYSWSTIVKNLLQGDLIYPWIERKK